MSAKTAVERIWADLKSRPMIGDSLGLLMPHVQEVIRNRLQVIIEEECGPQVAVPGGPSRAMKLRVAATLLSEVRVTLDLETEVCDSCQMQRYQNWVEKQGDEQLASAEKKILRWAEKL